MIYSNVQTMVTTNLQSLVSSATTGWQSAVVDNTTTTYDDALVQVVLAFDNVAPANSKCAFVFAYSGLDTTYAYPATGTQGTVTLQDITTNPTALRLIGTIPHLAANTTIQSSCMSVAAAFGGALPPKWGIIIVNHSGAALKSSGSSVTWRGVRHGVS